ncbi:MAG: hypothetical protein J0H02_06835 [Armatimonadetes bacterium]|nr:hypothetical protein [Armatimonadota bacterium]
MIRLILCFALISAVLVGCSGGTSDVSNDGVKSKEQQIKEASEKLNGGQQEDRGQGE